MHAEYGVVTEQTAAALNAARAAGGRIVAVGSTSLRLLESAADEHSTVARSPARLRSSSRRATSSAPSTSC